MGVKLAKVIVQLGDSGLFVLPAWLLDKQTFRGIESLSLFQRVMSRRATPPTEFLFLMEKKQLPKQPKAHMSSPGDSCFRFL